MSLSPARREASFSSFSSFSSSALPERASRRRRSCFSATALRPNVTRRIRAAWSVSVVASFSRSVERRSARVSSDEAEAGESPVSSRRVSSAARRSSSSAKCAYCSARQRASARRAPARRCAKARFHSPSARPRSSAEASALNSGSHAATSPYACHGASALPASAGLNGGGLSAADGRFGTFRRRFEGSCPRVVVPAASSASTSATSESRNSIADHARSFASPRVSVQSSGVFAPKRALRIQKARARGSAARAPCERRGKQVGAARGESLFVDR